ncbi:MAG TPA: hypothetical protein VFM54_02150 [Micromonosporaceae bacterium]|nr:hypothetical protein [Micromonosporaceae bacterium]
MTTSRPSDRLRDPGHPAGPDGRLRRRALLGAVAATGATGLGLGLSRAGELPAALGLRPGRADPEPVTMAMHLHGPFSEGQASMAAHLTQAQRLGVDVVWWTDHDWRMSGYGYREAVRFDSLEEHEDGRWWRWTPEREGALRAGGGELVDEPHSPDEPGRALRLVAAGEGTMWYAASAWNFTYRTSLADTELELDVLRETATGRLLVEVTASYHPPTGGRPAGQYAVRYEAGGDGPGVARRAEGLRGVVELPAAAGRWQRLRLRPVDDLAAIWPDLVAEDNSLFRLRVGLTAGPAAAAGGTARAVVDRLRLRRTQRAGQSGLHLRDELMRRYAARYPRVAQRSGLEVSLVRHLNWYGGDLRLPDYGGRPPVIDPSLPAAEAMVGQVHRAGGLVSYNHPMQGEVAQPGALARLLVDRRALGCDLVEIGYPGDLDKLLWVLDATARNAVFYTGVGVSDDHAGTDWLEQRANYLTGVWAASTGTADLLGGLRAGRAWFANPKHWRGVLDLRHDGRGAMGGALVTAYPRVDVTVLATDLPAGGALELVVGRADLAGAARAEPAVVRTTAVPARQVRGGSYGMSVEPGGGAYLRAVVRSGDGSVAGVGNPLWLLPHDPPHGIPAARRLTA